MLLVGKEAQMMPQAGNEAQMPQAGNETQIASTRRPLRGIENDIGRVRLITVL